MIEVHAFATPNSVKVLIALEEMGLAYDLKPVNVRKGEQKAEAFLALNPNGKVPVLVDDLAGQHLVLTGSAAILVHLAEETGKLWRRRQDLRLWQRTLRSLEAHNDSRPLQSGRNSRQELRRGRSGPSRPCGRGTASEGPTPSTIVRHCRAEERRSTGNGTCTRRPGWKSIYLIRFDHNGKQLVAPQWGDSRGRVEVVFGWPNADNAKFPGGVGPVDSAWNLWVDPTNSDRIYVAGHGPGPEGSGRVNLDRYVAALKTVDGSPEPSFNHGTPVSYNSLNDLTDNNRRAKVEADGSILSAGWTDFGKGFGNYATILRILPDGTFDPNFGNFIYPPETGTKLGIKPQPGVAIFNPLQADGGMTESYAAMAAGPGNWISSGPGEATAAETPSSLGFKTATANDVVAVAFDKKGLRTDWGKGGFQVVQSEGTSAKDPHEEIADAVMLPDGRSVSVGLYGAAPAAIVLKPDGSLDTSVSGDGIIELPNEKVRSGFNAAFLSPDGKRIAIASDVDEKGARLVVLSDQ